MSKTILLIDTDKLDQLVQKNLVDPGNFIRGLSQAEAILQKDGTWILRECNGANGHGPPQTPPPNPTDGQSYTENGVTWIWHQHTNTWITKGSGINFRYIDSDCDFLEVLVYLAKHLGIDLQDPLVKGPICTCPTKCDCQDYERGLVSNECPIHNNEPQPSPECPQHGLRLLT